MTAVSFCQDVAAQDLHGMDRKDIGVSVTGSGTVGVAIAPVIKVGTR